MGLFGYPEEHALGIEEERVPRKELKSHEAVVTSSNVCNQFKWLV
jgi:hypothetical protein